MENISNVYSYSNLSLEQIVRKGFSSFQESPPEIMVETASNLFLNQIGIPSNLHKEARSVNLKQLGALSAKVHTKEYLEKKYINPIRNFQNFLKADKKKLFKEAENSFFYCIEQKKELTKDLISAIQHTVQQTHFTLGNSNLSTVDKLEQMNVRLIGCEKIAENFHELLKMPEFQSRKQQEKRFLSRMFENTKLAISVSPSMGSVMMINSSSNASETGLYLLAAAVGCATKSKLFSVSTLLSIVASNLIASRMPDKVKQHPLHIKLTNELHFKKLEFNMEAAKLRTGLRNYFISKGIKRIDYHNGENFTLQFVAATGLAAMCGNWNPMAHTLFSGQPSVLYTKYLVDNYQFNLGHPQHIQCSLIDSIAYKLIVGTGLQTLYSVAGPNSLFSCILFSELLMNQHISSTVINSHLYQETISKPVKHLFLPNYEKLKAGIILSEVADKISKHLPGNALPKTLSFLSKGTKIAIYGRGVFEAVQNLQDPMTQQKLIVTKQTLQKIGGIYCTAITVGYLSGWVGPELASLTNAVLDPKDHLSTSVGLATAYFTQSPAMSTIAFSATNTLMKNPTVKAGVKNVTAKASQMKDTVLKRVVIAKNSVKKTLEDSPLKTNFKSMLERSGNLAYQFLTKYNKNFKFVFEQ